MQLSVTNPPIDPNLAALLLGNLSPAPVAPDATAGTPLTGFAAWLEQSVAPTGAAIVPGETPTEGGEMPVDAGGMVASTPMPWAFASPAPVRSESHPHSKESAAVSSDGKTAQVDAPRVTASATATPGQTMPPASAKTNSGKAQSAALAGAVARRAEKTIEQGREDAVSPRAAERVASATVDSTPLAASQAAPNPEPCPANVTASNQPASMPDAASEQLAIAATPHPRPSSPAHAAELTAAAADVGPVPLRLGASSGEKSAGSSNVTRSADGHFGSNSPFPAEVRKRGPVDWPLTAHPETKTSAGETFSRPSRADALAFDGEAITSPFQLPGKTTQATDRVLSPTSREHPAATSPSYASPLSSSVVPVSNLPVSSPSLVNPLAKPEATPAGQFLAPDASTAALATQARISVEHTAATSRSVGAPIPAKNAEANIAVSTAVLSPRRASAENASAKHFVSAASAWVTEGQPAFGTSVAKPLDAMPSAPTLPLEAATAHDSVAAAASSSGQAVSSEASFETHFAPEAMSTAHRAVEAVMSAVHRFTARDHHAVNLQFSVGGADLSVRVEMRADEVRATFTTDSAELRAALSHEWHAAQSTSTSDRPVRLANPVFASSDGSNFGAADQNASRHRNSQPGDSNQPFSLAGLRSRAARAAAFEASVPVVAPVISRAPLSTTLHLHTLA